MGIKLPAGTEFKTFHFEVKSVDATQGLVTGYLSTFNTIDLGNGHLRDRVRPGAFKKTLGDALSRKEHKGKKFLWPHLWMHDPMHPTGGYIDGKEDEKGLLVTFQLDISTNAAGFPNNPQAVLEFSGYKQGYIDEQSIGYETIKSSIVEEEIDGDKVMVRDLLELRLVEGSSCTSGFAMNPEASVVAIKTTAEIEDNTTSTPLENATVDEEILSEKVTIVGSTSGPIGPRDEAWSGPKAKAQIWAVAFKGGKINETLARKYFMVLDGDPQNKGSWKYPFWYVGSNPHISVGAVKAIAGLAMGARGVNAPGGLRAKVARLYARINRKYPQATPLIPPWKGKRGDDGVETKSFDDIYAEACKRNVLGDWYDLTSSLTKSMLSCLGSDDEESDHAALMSEILDAFKKAALDWVDMAVEYEVPDLVGDIIGSTGDGDASILNTMSADTRELLKTGARLSSTTRNQLTRHIDGLRQRADDLDGAVATHTSAIRTAADDLATIMQGAEAAYGTDPGTPHAGAQGTDKSLARREPSNKSLTRDNQPGTPTEKDEMAAALARLDAILSN